LFWVSTRLFLEDKISVIKREEDEEEEGDGGEDNEPNLRISLGAWRKSCVFVYYSFPHTSELIQEVKN
jgi:hypothetical protein